MKPERSTSDGMLAISSSEDAATCCVIEKPREKLFKAVSCICLRLYPVKQLISSCVRMVKGGCCKFPLGDLLQMLADAGKSERDIGGQPPAYRKTDGDGGEADAENRQSGRAGMTTRLAA